MKLVFGCLLALGASSCSDSPQQGPGRGAEAKQQGLCWQPSPCGTFAETAPESCSPFPDYTKCANSVSLDGQAPLGRQVEWLWNAYYLGQDERIQYDRDLGQPVTGKIDLTRVSVLKGLVQTVTGSPPALKGAAGVRVEVVSESGYGQVETEWGSQLGTPGPDPAIEPTGRYFIAVNAGGPAVRLRFSKAGYFPAERVVQPVAGQYVALEPVELVAVPSTFTTVTPGVQAAVSGSEQSDDAGTRTARVFFPASTEWHEGSITGNTITQQVRLRVQEFTVGDTGEQRMPATLPPTSAYTFALAIQATTTTEQPLHPYFVTTPLNPVVAYVENFAKIDRAATVPSGYYDSMQGKWVQSSDAGGALNGKVVKILSYTTDTPPAANVDITGDATDENAEFSLAERQQLAAWYQSAVPNTPTLWRVPLPHFSELDFNWSFGLPWNAIGALFGVSIGGSDRSCATNGSIIECENQVLGEEIPIVGSPYRLVYRSDRAPGYAAGRQARLTIPKDTIPPSAKRILFSATVAGKDSSAPPIIRPASGWATGIDQFFDYTWDGTDAFGRTPSGAQPATFKIGLVYDGDYAPTAQFGLPPSASSFTASPTLKEITLWKTWTGTLGGLDARTLGFRGWTLSEQHAYAPGSQTVYFGYGGQQRGSVLAQKISGFAGSLNAPRGVSFGPDGALYVANSKNAEISNGTPQDGEVLRILNGATTVLPFGTLKNPTDVVVAPDGTVYVTEAGRHRVKKLPPGGQPTTVAGSDAPLGEEGDSDGQGTASRLRFPAGLALSPDGSVYIADFLNHKVKRIAPNGLVTTVVNTSGLAGSGGDGDASATNIGLATAAKLSEPVGLDFDLAGNLYIADRGDKRIRRVNAAGRISTFAGGGSDETTEGVSATGATGAKLPNPYHVAVGPDGSLYIADNTSRRVRKITSEGRIVSVAGSGGPSDCTGDGAGALNARFKAPDGVAVGPDGALYVSDDMCNTVRKVVAPVPGVTLGTTIVPSADASEFYTFDEVGRHLATTDAWTGKPRFQLDYTQYTSGKLLTAIRDLRGASDGVGIETVVERDSVGTLSGIHTSSWGQGLDAYPDANGFLGYVQTRGNYRSWGAQHSASGLLEAFVDTHYHSFVYESDGRLKEDHDSHPAAAFRTLSRTFDGTTATVTVTTPSGLSTTYRDERLSSGAHQRTVTQPDSTSVTASYDLTGGRTVTLSDVSIRTAVANADPRFGTAAPTTTETLNLGTKSIIVDVQRTPQGPLDPLTFTSLTETRTIKSSATDQGKAYVTTIDRTNPAAPFIRFTAPSNRKVKASLDAYGRVTSFAQDPSPESAAVTYEYDNGGAGPGRLTRITQGNRRVRFDWDPYTGLLTAVHQGTPAGETMLSTYYSFDNDGFLWRRVSATTDVFFSFDQGGGLQWFGHDAGWGPGHSLSPHWWFDGLYLYDPPDVQGVPNDATIYLHDTDRRPNVTTWPNSSTLTFAYHPQGTGSRGRIQSLTGASPTGTTTFSYDGVGRPAAVTTSTGVTTAFSFDGDATHGWGKLLHKQSTTWPQGAATDVVFEYDAYTRVSSETPANGLKVSYVYDDDSLVVNATATGFNFDISDRSSVSGRIASAKLQALGPTITSYSYDSTYGDLNGLATTRNGANVYYYTLTRDDWQGLGRVESKTEKLDSNPTVTTWYGYDPEGRLANTTDSWYVHDYWYDTRGNRTWEDGVQSTYDDQDRILTRGSFTGYTHDAAGRRTQGLSAYLEQYTYDAAGNLIRVDYPDYPNESAQYTVDGLGRRITRKVVLWGNVIREQRWLYAEDNRIVAELDGTGGLTKQFVYASGRHVPDLMLQGGTVYRILTDHLGSVRRVVNLSTGYAEQTIEYDPWGKILWISGDVYFQPFGFAGGLIDPDTGLVHFGAREYDPWTGRFLTRDPSLFEGGLNLYAYANNDPINYVDRTGRNPLLLIAIGAAEGAAIDIGFQLALNGGNVGCIDWAGVGTAAAIGGVTAGLLGPGASMGRAGWKALASDTRGALAPFNAEQRALIGLAKEAKHTGVTTAEADTLLDWAKQLGIPSRGPEFHPNRPVGMKPHIHIGPINHILIR